MTSANMRGTNMKLANLQHSILTNADLTGASKLTLEQFEEVLSISGAKLDSNILEEIKDNLPELLNSND